MGINRVLLSGQLQLDNDKRIIVIIDKSGTVRHFLEYDEIEASDWGFVYERHVGLHFEAKGYSVSYLGATRGFSDGGIDLIVEKSDFKQFIQCKYGVSHKLSKQRIELLLYKASSFLTKEYRGEMLNFALAIPSIAQMFFSRKVKSVHGERLTFPMADYFLSKNKVQNRVKVAILEVPMDVADKPLDPTP